MSSFDKNHHAAPSSKCPEGTRFGCGGGTKIWNSFPIFMISMGMRISPENRRRCASRTITSSRPDFARRYTVPDPFGGVAGDASVASSLSSNAIKNRSASVSRRNWQTSSSFERRTSYKFFMTCPFVGRFGNHCRTASWILATLSLKPGDHFLAKYRGGEEIIRRHHSKDVKSLSKLPAFLPLRRSLPQTKKWTIE